MEQALRTSPQEKLTLLRNPRVRSKQNALAYIMLMAFFKDNLACRLQKIHLTGDPFLIHFGCLLKNKSFPYLVVKFDN